MLEQQPFSEEAIKGLGRIRLAVPSRPHAMAKDRYTEKLRSLAAAFPYLHSVQCSYDSVDKHADTSPLSAFCKVAALRDLRQCSVPIGVDTRFSRDNWDGAEHDLVDFRKEYNLVVNRLEDRLDGRGHRMNLSGRLHMPDSVSMDIDFKTSTDLLSRTSQWLRNDMPRTVIDAVIGTSRKPASEYSRPAAQYCIELLDQLDSSGINFATVTCGAQQGQEVYEAVMERLIDTTVCLTGAYIDKYSNGGVYTHAAPLNIEDGLPKNTIAVIGTPVMHASDPLEALVDHAVAIGIQSY